MDKYTELLADTIAGYTLVHIAIIEHLHDRGLVDKAQIANALFQHLDALGSDLRTPQTKHVVEAVAGFFLRGTNADLSNIQSLLRKLRDEPPTPPSGDVR
ncbi:MAG: hypothetical protein AB1705_18790 [Verrucomicrobiota bacterium]